MLRIDAGSSRNASASGRASIQLPSLLDEAPRIAQVADDVGHEERAAFGLLVNQLRRATAGSGAAETSAPGSARHRGARKPSANLLERTVRAAARRGWRGTGAAPGPCRRAGRWRAPARASGRSGRPGSSARRSSRRPPNADRRGTARTAAAAMPPAAARRARVSSAPAIPPALLRACAPPSPGWRRRAPPARTRSARQS